MTAIEPITDRERAFAEAFAAAAAAFVTSRRPQGIWYLPDANRFVHSQVDDGTSPTDCDWWVSDRWQELTGPVAAVTDADADGYSEPLLKTAIESKLIASCPELRALTAAAFGNFAALHDDAA